MSHAEQVRAFGDAGCRFVQIREKHASSDEFYSAALEAVRVARQYDMKVIINDRVDVAIAVEADGVHLGQDDLPADQARRLLGEKAIIGVSTHSVEQAIIASSLPADYIAIGPVFATNTKENPDPIVGVDGLIRVRKALRDKIIVAIGGINMRNVAAIIEAGADSAAVISDLYVESVDPSSRFRTFLEIANRVQQF